MSFRARRELLKAANTGDAVCVEIHLIGEGGESWDGAWQAIGAGPRLLKNGAVCLKPGAEGFRSDVLQGRAPRSAVAMTRDGKLLLAAVDGRQMVSGGLTLLELAEWLRDEGAVEAINLDGGGSTTLALRQLVVNQPSQGTQRPVANALVIALDPQPAAEEGELALLAPEGMEPVEDALVMPAGTRVRFRAAKRLPDGTWQDLPEDAVTWSLEGQVGLLTQDGALLPMRAGTGTVAFSTGRQVARARVRTVAGPPAAVTTRFEAPPALGEPATIWACVRDAYGNPVTVSGYTGLRDGRRRSGGGARDGCAGRGAVGPPAGVVASRRAGDGGCRDGRSRLGGGASGCIGSDRHEAGAGGWRRRGREDGCDS